MGVLVQGCREADFDPVAQTCAAPFWTLQETGIPALSIADAQAVGTSLALLWAVAWGFRRIQRLIDQS